MTDMITPHHADDSDSGAKPGLARHLPLIVIALVAIVGFFTLREYLSFETLRENRDMLLGWRDNNLVLAALGFVAVYILIVAFSLPGAAVASVTGGFLFGLAGGTALNVIAATIGAVAIFLAARWGLGAILTEKLETSHGKLHDLKERLNENEISVLLLLRLVPVVPFFVANLLPAMVGVKLRNFVWTTAVGIIPGGIVFTSIGDGLGVVFDRGENPDLSLLWEPHILGPLLGLSALAALPIFIKAVRGKKGV